LQHPDWTGQDAVLRGNLKRIQKKKKNQLNREKKKNSGGVGAHLYVLEQVIFQHMPSVRWHELREPWPFWVLVDWAF